MEGGVTYQAFFDALHAAKVRRDSIPPPADDTDDEPDEKEPQP